MTAASACASRSAGGTGTSTANVSATSCVFPSMVFGTVLVRRSTLVFTGGSFLCWRIGEGEAVRGLVDQAPAA
jgi:hypothetical protein